MLPTRRLPLNARVLCRSGLTRTELLVVLFILLILAAVSVGPILDHFERARINRAVDSARTLNTLLSQYATDNDGVYPSGLGTSAPGKSEGIARNLLENNYTPDPAIFALGSAPRYSGKDTNFDDILPANVSWDFTGGATASTGIATAAPDLLPTIYCTGESITYSSGLDLPLSGHGPFGRKGIVVAYKGNNVEFIRGVPDGASVKAPQFISGKFSDKAVYTQIKP
jgi:type II secretory pathway pseudopilin PulG